MTIFIDLVCISSSVERTPSVDKILSDTQLFPSFIDKLANIDWLDGLVGPGLGVGPTDLLLE